MTSERARRIRTRMRWLRFWKPSIFGAEVHRFVLHPALPESELAAFERLHGIELPPEYRWFIGNVANGGAGPYYGLFPLGVNDMGGGPSQRWSEHDGHVGRLATPFPFTEPWKAPSDIDADWLEIDGAMPICDMGCAFQIWLVITGPERGTIWEDFRADGTGLMPATRMDGGRYPFLDWYEWNLFGRSLCA